MVDFDIEPLASTQFWIAENDFNYITVHETGMARANQDTEGHDYMPLTISDLKNYKRVKKVWYIHQYFKTPQEGGAIRSYHIAKGMVARGMHVEMITAYNKSKYIQKTIDGIHVHYLPVKYANDFSFSRRYYAFFLFVWKAIRLAKKLEKADLCYVTSTPLTVGVIALWLKKTMEIPYIFEVRDLWPEAPIQMGILKSWALVFLAKKLEKASYFHASRIIALSPGIEKNISKSMDRQKIRMIPNMADVDTSWKSIARKTESSQFMIGYFGAFGLANHLEYLLEIARECQRSGLPVQFILVGEGAGKKALKSMAAKWTLKNVTFLGHQNRPGIHETMRGVDACFTSFLQIPIFETNSPNKFFDGLAAGKLSIVNTKGWLRDLVEEHDCGFYTNPDMPQEFPKLITPFLKDRSLLRSFQENGKRLGAREFAKEKLVNEICDLVLEVS